MPVEMKGGGFPITLKIPKQRFSKRFRSEEEVRQWVQSEVDWWDERTDNGQYKRFVKHLTSNLLSEALRSSQAIDVLQAIERSGVLLSSGKQGQILQEIYDENPLQYPGAVAALSANTIDFSAGNISAHLQQQAISWPVLISGFGGVLAVASNDRARTAEKKAFEELVTRTQTAAEESETQRVKIDELHDVSKKRFDQAHDAQKQVIEMTSEHFREMLELELQHSKAQIADLERQVRDRLVLEAPTKYWTEKAISHRTTAAIFGGIFIAALAGGVYWLTHFGVDLVGEAYKTIVGNRENPGLLALVPLAFITLPTLAFAWLLRHVSRIIVQNLSLQADAQLRGTIATTYSALVHEKNSNTPELAIALNALFRPVDGSGHAEIAPPNVKDILEMGK